MIINTLFKLSSTKIKFFLFLIFIVSTIIGQNQTTKSDFTSFYRYIPEKMTWDEHKKLAAIMGGDLACITNAYENEQVRRIAGGEIVWTGGVRKGCGNDTGADHWYWSNGKKWSYTNWRQGEPNNYSEYDENRVMFWENGEWNDASLLHKFSAVYELPLKDHSVDYFENNDIKTKESNKIKRNPFSTILGSVLSIGTVFTVRETNLMP